MAYRFKQNLLSAAKRKVKCPNIMVPQYITVHNTYNDASAANEVKYMISNNNSTSFHIAVDDKEVVLGVPLDRNAWHCGDGNGPGNRKSIGIEICYSKSGGPRYNQAEANAITLIVQMLKERGWGIDRVKQHYDWSKKNCPHRIRNEGRWSQFLSRIESQLKKNPPAIVAKADDNKLYRVVTGTFKDVKSQKQAIKNLLTLFKHVYPYDATGLRAITGTFKGRSSAEAAAAKIKAKFGYVVYIKEA